MGLDNKIESNPLIDRLPSHLKKFIKPQNYNQYTSINQAVWRYVMKKNISFLSRVAHKSYLDGLVRTGIDIESIPNMYGMNRILKEIGWAAVAVDGFIPPNAFMEFQAFKVLVIASDMRQLENIQYTPAPDIIHESAGHAPIIANPDYAEYLRRMGEIGAKAILSGHDMEIYEAVRRLSILKEADGVDKDELKEAHALVKQLQEKDVEPSEMAQVRNLQWWTVEYGLIGTFEDPKIYGAGLLSSIGESRFVFDKEVKKIPYSIDAAFQSFDITRPQPHLFVAESFSHLMAVLEEFANTLSVRKGGSRSILKLVSSGTLGTVELSSGVQVSGKFVSTIRNSIGEVIYFRTEGPTAISYREKELIGHGIKDHFHGFSSPLGNMLGVNMPIEDMGPADLKVNKFQEGRSISFQFESGIKVKGVMVTGVRNVQGKLMLIQFDECTVSYQKEILFKPSYGVFDMVIGNDITSGYSGAADFNSFPDYLDVSQTVTIKPVKSELDFLRESRYANLRNLREEGDSKKEMLIEIFEECKVNYPYEWLLLLEIIEISDEGGLKKEINQWLSGISREKPKLELLIKDGLELY
ncbi:MAG: aromatic amino acid hydroxylase [Flavobacteriales bacterium]|nr:aromatic amino acid hydroxylase [Flavobacteriales bacterium]